MTLQRRPDEAEFTWDVMMPVWIAHVTPPLLLVACRAQRRLAKQTSGRADSRCGPRRLFMLYLTDEPGRAVLLWQASHRHKGLHRRSETETLSCVGMTT